MPDKIIKRISERIDKMAIDSLLGNKPKDDKKIELAKVELKTCFCKSKVIRRSEKVECFGHGAYAKVFKVYCSKCGANVETSEFNGETMVDAEKKWNILLNNAG